MTKEPLENISQRITNNLRKGKRGSEIVYLYKNDEAPLQIIDMVKKLMIEKGFLVRAEIRVVSKKSVEIIFTQIK